jgi:hypothetical protein
MNMRFVLLIALSVRISGAQEQEERPVIPPLKTTVVITATPVEPALDRRNSEVFERTLFSRDDQIFHALDAGIDAGQHEGGGKSLEVRRFGFNLDHGGANGGLKVMVDNQQQNQTTQGHGQGYLGSLKTLTPELVEEVSIVNGPFSAEYGDFSSLGVVQIRTRRSLEDVWTARIQGGSFGAVRGFLGFSPDWKGVDSLVAYEGSHTDGPFLSPLGYNRHNVAGNYTRRYAGGRSLGFRYNGGWNSFHSSGQIPLDEVAAGRLDRFGFVDPWNGGKVRSGTAGVYYSGGDFKADAFVTRSLFDLFTNFTFYLNDALRGDAFQQHDSRLIEGASAQYRKLHKAGGVQAMLTAGANYYDNQILVGLNSIEERNPWRVMTRDHANVTNGAGYVQESVSLLGGRIEAGAGLRIDQFRYRVAASGTEWSTVAQPKANFAYTPSARLPVTLYANYGRGIATADARVVAQTPGAARVAATDFFQLGAAQKFGRFSSSVDGFWIDRSHEQVYIADEGTVEFQGPSRAYGFEAKASAELTRKLSLNGGFTKVVNAFFRGVEPRTYVTGSPHLVANAGLTLSNWKGWSGSVRMRAISHYRLNAEDSAVLAAGHTVFDLGMSRRVRRGVEISFALDNFTDCAYWETQNYFESRLAGQEPAYRIHGTPGYPVTVTLGLTLRFRGK